MKNGSSRVWDLTTGKKRPRLKGDQGMVTAMFFTGNSRTLATASKKTSSYFGIWKIPLYIIRKKRKLGGINALALSSDGRTLAIGLADDTVRIVDSQGFDESLRLTGYHNPVRAMEISPNNQFIASGSEKQAYHCRK